MTPAGARISIYTPKGVDWSPGYGWNAGRQRTTRDTSLYLSFPDHRTQGKAEAFPAMHTIHHFGKKLATNKTIATTAKPLNISTNTIVAAAE